MKIGIIGGTGKEGRGMALRWALKGHDVFIGSRKEDKAKEAVAALNPDGAHPISGGANEWAVAQAEVVMLSVPYGAHRATLEGLKTGLSGKILIDITVPLQPPKVREVHLPEGTAAALEGQALLGDSVKVVAAMHHISSVHLADPEHAIECDVLACSDHEDALEAVMGLIDDLGLKAYHAGPLRNAVALESLTPVLLHLNKRYKGPGAGIRLTGL